uniref:Ejaculatory bulb-specific protein 3 n=1 Tax=Cacopsylla melanoneura TaxID=428564 RepID=A0A8D8U1L7_9HEMI
MFKLCCAAVGLLVVAQLCAGAATKKYTTKYDNVDIDQILSNDRLFNSYYNCLLDKGSCTPDAAELKTLLPDAIATECKSCSEKQKTGSAKIFKYLIEKKPEHWANLEKKYDPNGTYKAKYQKELADLKAGKPLKI